MSDTSLNQTSGDPAEDVDAASVADALPTPGQDETTDDEGMPVENPSG